MACASVCETLQPRNRVEKVVTGLGTLTSEESADTPLPGTGPTRPQLPPGVPRRPLQTRYRESVDATVSASRRKLDALVDVGRPAGGAAPLPVPEAGQRHRFAVEVSGRDEDAAAEPRRQRLDRRPRDVRDDELRRRQLGGKGVGEAHLDLHAVPLGVAPRLLDRLRLDVDGAHGPISQPRGGDRQHAGAAADVEDAAAAELAPEVDEELQAEPR